MKTSIIIYIGTWIVPLVLAALYLCGVITGQGQLVQIDGTLSYMLSVVTVVLSILTVYLALRIFNLPIVKMRFKTGIENECKKFYHTLSRIRSVAIFVAIILNLSTYYLFASDSNLYLSAIMLVALLFCVPRKSELNDLRNNNPK